MNEQSSRATRTNKIITKEIDLNGRKLKLETGKLALQADASVVVTLGETVALVTVTTKPTLEATDHFPLSVEYVEKFYAGGRISSSKFLKRENRPSDEAILTGRLIDRSIRPLFPKDFHNEVQVIITVLSVDQLNDPDIVGLIGTSAALSVSSVPWHGPLGAARIGEKDGSLMANPLQNEMEHFDLDLLVASTKDKVVMIEAGGKEVMEETMLTAMQEAHKQSQQVIDLIAEFSKEAGKEKQTYSAIAEAIEEALLDEVKKLAHDRIEAALFDKEHAWHEATGDMIKEELALKYKEILTPQIVSGIFDKAAKEIMNDTILNKGTRVDGRKMDEVRPILAEVDLLPRAHGSAMFQRGDTQVLSVVTLGATALGQTIETMTGEEQKKFMHHYNMSINPFATGEIKRIGAPNRRDTDHGAMVEKALSFVMPKVEDFPYAIRVVSEVLAANASTSMASLCASTLALMDAGVPLTSPVAGIAMGLLSGPGKFQVITDMRAVEDFYGEMDFKISGTRTGITAIQMDTKLEGLSFEIIEEALTMGKAARSFILDKMAEILPKHGELSPHAPKIETLHIEQSEIGMLIGPGGKNINGIISQTGAQINVEEDGTVMVSSVSEESIKKAVAAIEGMFRKVNAGEEYLGKVVKLMPFGAFVEILPGKEGLVHVSQMAPGHVESPEDIVSEGQEVKVRVTDVSPEGKIGLSMLFGADVKPESEGRPGRSSGTRPSRFGVSGGEGRGPRPSFGGGARSSFSRGPRTRTFSRGGFGSPRPGFGGGNRGGTRDRSGRGGFNR